MELQGRGSTNHGMQKASDDGVRFGVFTSCQFSTDSGSSCCCSSCLPGYQNVPKRRQSRLYVALRVLDAWRTTGQVGILPAAYSTVAVNHLTVW
jgi:hypothetical protein